MPWRVGPMRGAVWQGNLELNLEFNLELGSRDRQVLAS